MQKKKGISLIVLVITIIVMIILAAAIIISISNSGIVNRANEAVDATNEAQMKQMVTLAWSEAFFKDTTETKDDAYYLKEVKAYLIASGITELEQNKYVITATTSGVSVKKKDTIAPIVEVTLGEKTYGSIAVSVVATDNEVGTIEYRYYIKGPEDTDYVLKETSTASVYTYSGLMEQTSYDILVEVEDSNENITQKYIVDVVTNKIELTTIGALVASAADYGKTVNYSANGVTDWKVFYKQTVDNEEYVYLIASKKIPNESIPTKLALSIANGGAGATVNGMSVSWEEEKYPSTAATIQHPTLWLANWSNYNAQINGKCVSYFLDETFWTEFKNTTTYGDNVVGAIGTPTAEMFVASWNAKREVTNKPEIYNKKLALVANGTVGYYINDITLSNTASSNTTEQDIFVEDNLYVLGTGIGDMYWLASPSAYGSGYLLATHYNPGGITHVWYTSFFDGVRPVICLKSSTPAYLALLEEETDILLK